MVTAEIKRLSPTAKLPERGTQGSAGYDLHADIPNTIFIRSGETKVVGTGLAITAPVGHFGAIFARSGLAIKQGLGLGNAVAVIDRDFTGEIMIGLFDTPHG